MPLVDDVSSTTSWTPVRGFSVVDVVIVFAVTIKAENCLSIDTSSSIELFWVVYMVCLLTFCSVELSGKTELPIQDLPVKIYFVGN